MFQPFALYIGLRYTRAKRRNHFISFISLTSMMGIALGVAILITVLSVMNGFDQEIRSRIFGMANQVTISSLSGSLSNWQSLSKKLEHYPGITGVAPLISGQGILVNNGTTHPVQITGVLPEREKTVSVLNQKIISGSFSALRAGQFGIVLGVDLASQLGASLGDKITLLIPKLTVTPLGAMPRFKQFTVIGIYKVGSGFGFDSDMAFTHLKDAQTLFQMGNGVSGVRLKLQDLYAAPKLAQQLAQRLPPTYLVGNWTETYGSYLHAVQLEKTMMFLILIFLVAIAAFNLVSMLVMVVTDKQSDIAILRTLGATPKMILAIFVVQGSLIGIVGTLLGLIGGVTLALHVTELVNFLEKIFHVSLFSSDVYFLNYLPSQLALADVVHICLTALVMSLLATLYPAWHAARTQPAEALRYE
jgi:lipoprotein-releasing system permease protein